MPPAEPVARTQTPPAFRFRRHVARGAGLSPCTERHSAGHAKQRAAGPRWPEEPLAQLSWASPRTAGAVASRHLRPGMSVGRPSLSVKMLPHVCRAAARRFSISGFSAERVGPPHACGRRCLCATTGSAWLRRSLRPGRVPKQSRHPALLDLGALLLRQHRGAPAAAVKRMRLRIGSENDPSPGPGP